MRPILILGLLTIALLALPEFETISHLLHPAYYVMIIFFSALTYALLRVDFLLPPSIKPQAALIKISMRFLASLIFIAIVMYQYEDPHKLVVQFILIYLIYLIFEIVIALTNLRRN